MEISSLSPNLINLLSQEPVKNAISELMADENAEGSFASILSDAFKTVEETDKKDKVSSLELLMGESDDLAGLMLDMQKAELSLNLALQIRNKVIDAYNEVMRMSV